MAAVIGGDLALAASLLRAGELVAIPTETVYGLAGNGLDETAVLSIFRAKRRPTFDPLILHTDRPSRLHDWVLSIPESLGRLADAFWPGPLTLLLPRRPVVGDLVTAGLPTVAVRIPSHPLARELLARLDFPLAAPSANPFGYISPTEAAHVAAQLGDVIPYILDGGPCAVGVESTIVGLDVAGEPVIVRPGGIPIEALGRLVPGIRHAKPSALPRAPGELPSHYAPRTPLTLLEKGAPLPPIGPGVAVVPWHGRMEGVAARLQFELSPDGTMEGAARNLYRALRLADASGAASIVAWKVDEEGLGRAVNDRLVRAANRG